MKKILATTLALSLLATAGVANAQSYSHRGDHSRYEQSRGHDRSDYRGRDNDRRDNDRRGHGWNRSDNRYEQRASHSYRAGRYQAPRGYQNRQWRRGERMPSAYRGAGYVIDHRRYGLNAPPRGYQYVRSGNDAVLAAVATGVIASIVVSLFQ